MEFHLSNFGLSTLIERMIDFVMNDKIIGYQHWYIYTITNNTAKSHRVWYQNHMNLELSIMSNIHFIHSFQFFLILKLVTQKKTNTINEFGMPLHPMYFIWTERIILFLYNLKPLWAVIKYSTRMYTMWWFVM